MEILKEEEKLTNAEINKIFQEMNITTPKNILNVEINLKKEIIDYFSQFERKDKIAFKVAYEHLGTSFHILRSNGFKEWKKKQKK